jgi:hypothetical protein
LEALDKKYDGIPPEHLWNFDEKGVQMGGGRKNTGRVFIYFRKYRNRYKISSDNLELVTIVECVNAAGQSMPPSFVLSDGPMPNLTKLPAGSISRYVFIHSLMKGPMLTSSIALRPHLLVGPMMSSRTNGSKMFSFHKHASSASIRPSPSFSYATDTGHTRLQSFGRPYTMWKTLQSLFFASRPNVHTKCSLSTL